MGVHLGTNGSALQTALCQTASSCGRAPWRVGQVGWGLQMSLRREEEHSICEETIGWEACDENEHTHTSLNERGLTQTHRIGCLHAWGP